MRTFFLKAARFVFRKLGLSANQRVNVVFKGKIKDNESANRMIFDIIQKGTPSMISRFGTPESKCLLNYLEVMENKANGRWSKLNAKIKGSVAEWRDDVKTDLQDLVGFFPTTDPMLERFSAFYIEQVKKIDSIGVWGFVPGETFLIQKFCPSAIAYNPEALEPYYFNDPWSKALEGKRVLVIHPFSTLIQKQYESRIELFDNLDVLPQFQLITITAVQSIAGNKTEFDNWFEALNYMQREIDKVDFDVAIIGAGSYGLPLSAYIKDKGKISIHIGGATQILFGIKGKRWDTHPLISKFYNEYWVRPGISELVPDAQKVEGGCYW